MDLLNDYKECVDGIKEASSKASNIFEKAIHNIISIKFTFYFWICFE